jgi:hypothetical protein
MDPKITSHDAESEVDPRRSSRRVRLAVEASFIGLERRQTVTILDLSRTGARVAFSEPMDDKAGFIRWLEFETFGEAVWQEGLFIGLKFDRPLPVVWLQATEERCGDINEYEHERMMARAREWVQG